MLSLSRFFQPFFTTRPLSQIIYVGSRAKPKYQKLLNDVGKQLGIPVHWCLGGLASEKFRRNWERHRREHERREAEEAEEEEDEEEEDDEENAAAAAEEEERRQRDEAAAAAAATTLPESLRHGRHLSANDSSVRLDDATDQNGSRQSARVFEATRAATTGATAAATSTAAALSPSATRRTRKSATAGTRHLERRPTAGRHVSFTNHHDDDNNDVIARGRRPRHLDTCAQFIRNMLQRHKNQRKRGGTTSTATTPTSASSSAATPLVTDYVKTTLLNKNHRASKRLNARPKIGSLKKASQFLTLRDRSLNRLGFLALAAQRPPSSTTKQQQPLRSSSRTGWGGAMVTRAATGSLPSGSTTTTTPTPSPAARRRRRHQPKATTTTKRRRSRTNDDDGDDDDDVDEDEKASKNQKRTTTATTTNKTTMTRGRGQRRRRQNGNRVKFLVDDNEEKHRDGLYHDDDDNNDDDDDGDGKIHLSREDEAIVNRTIDAEEAESFDFLPDSLLLFDDCLVPISPLDHQRLPGSTTHNATASSSSSSSSSSPSSTINTRNKNNNNSNNAARQTQNAFTEALQFFSSLALEHAHHDSLHFVVTSQSVLSSAGTSAVARCFKTLRQNIDAHIVFDQPLQDARSFFKNLVSGAGEFEESRGIPLLITLKKMVDIFSPIFYLLLSF